MANQHTVVTMSPGHRNTALLKSQVTAVVCIVYHNLTVGLPDYPEAASITIA